MLFVCICCRDDQLALDRQLGGSFGEDSLSQWLLTAYSSSSRYNTLPECPCHTGMPTVVMVRYPLKGVLNEASLKRKES